MMTARLLLPDRSSPVDALPRLAGLMEASTFRVVVPESGPEPSPPPRSGC